MSTRLERELYNRAFQQALKEAKEAFPDLGGDNLDKAVAFRDRRIHEILLASPVPQVGALRLLEGKRVRKVPPSPAPAPALPIVPAPVSAPPPIASTPAPVPAPEAKPPPPKPLPPQERIADDLLIGANAIAAELGLTPHAVYHLVRTKQLRIGKLGKTLIASKTKLRRMIQNLT